VSAIKASGAKLVITSCPGCYSTLKSEYPQIVEDIPFEVKHISEIIAELIDENKISFKLKINEKVTYHDPCHLGRYEGVYEEPRKILYAIKGIEFVEMLRNKQNAFCCGGGTDLPLINPKLSLSIAKLRVNEAREAWAEAIVTSCPQCVKTLSLAAKTAQIKIFNLPILVVNAMGIR
jgi:heterodisulfide reductase subunit D